MVWKWTMKYTRYYIDYYHYHYVLKCKKEKCIWKIFVKYTQIRQSNTNTNISSCGFSNTNTNTYICVFKYKYKYKYVFDPSPGPVAFIRAWFHKRYPSHQSLPLQGCHMSGKIQFFSRSGHCQGIWKNVGISEKGQRSGKCHVISIGVVYSNPVN